MEIRKKFIINSTAHVVLNCSSERCSQSYHAHSAVVEVFLNGNSLDNADMLIDFGLLTPIKKFLNMFNQTLMIWEINPSAADIHEMSEFDYIVLPFNPTAENLALFYHLIINDIIKSFMYKNNEDPSIFVSKVKYHETKSGYACSNYDEAMNFGKSLVRSNILYRFNKDKRSISIENIIKGHGVKLVNPDPFKQV